MGNFLQEQSIQDMKNWPFNIMADRSNNTGLEKMLPVSVRIFDVNFGRVMTKFFDMNLLSDRDSGTAEVIFDKIDAQFTNPGVSWKNINGLGIDNTNANIGNCSSLKIRVLKKNGNCWMSMPHTTQRSKEGF